MRISLFSPTPLCSDPARLLRSVDYLLTIVLFETSASAYFDIHNYSCLFPFPSLGRRARMRLTTSLKTHSMPSPLKSLGASGPVIKLSSQLVGTHFAAS